MAAAAGFREKKEKKRQKSSRDDEKYSSKISPIHLRRRFIALSSKSCLIKINSLELISVNVKNSLEE